MQKKYTNTKCTDGMVINHSHNCTKIIKLVDKYSHINII